MPRLATAPTRSASARSAGPTGPSTCRARGRVRPRLHGVAVEDEAVDAFAEGPVAQVLDVGRMALPFLGVGRGERLGAEDRLAVDVGRGGHLGATVGRAELGPRPELAHRLVGLAGVGHLVARHAVVGLDREPQPVAVGQARGNARRSSRSSRSETVCRRSQRNRSETSRLSTTRPVKAGRKRQQVVAAPLLEFLAHAGRPVLRADFPTVDVRRDQHLAFPGQRPVVGDEPAHQAVEMGLGRFLAELVALQPAAGGRRGMVVLAGRGVAEAQDEPLARGHVPGELAVGVHLRRQVDDPVARDDRFGRHGRRSRPRCGGKCCGHGRRLALDVLDADLALRRRAWPARRCRGRNRARPAAGPARRRSASGPRPASRSRRPSAWRVPGVIHGPPLPHQPASLFMLISQAQPVGLAAGVLEQFAPQRAGEIGRSLGRALVDFHVQHAADADPRHRLEIGGDAFLREIAVEREPVDPGPGRRRRGSETRGQVVRGTGRLD